MRKKEKPSDANKATEKLGEIVMKFMDGPNDQAQVYSGTASLYK